MEKQCSKCKQIKSISEFRKDKYSKDGYTTRCKYCIDHKYKNVCLQCGKEFLGSHKTQKFCSKECNGKYNIRQVIFNCDYCGKESTMCEAEFYKEGKTNHYCSKYCKNKHHSKLISSSNHPNWKGGEITFLCDYCGNKSSQKRADYNSSEHHYCSIACMGKHKCKINTREQNANWKGGDIYFNCDYCGKESHCPQHQYNLSKTGRHYCSSECKMKHLGILNSGENHHNYNFNLTDEERISNRDYNDYYKWRKSVFEKYNYTCQCCGKRGGDLVAHHLDGYDNFPTKRLDIKNGVALCKVCHKEFHHLYKYGNNTKEQFNEFLKSKNIKSA